MNGIRLENMDFLNQKRQMILFEDFLSGAPDEWTAAGDTAAGTDAIGGQLDITTTGTDNNEATLTLDNKIVVVAASKTISFMARVQYAEANTDDANVFVGLTDEAVATILGDDGAGPPADYTGVGFHKLDGGTNWIAEVANGTTHETVTLDANGSLNKIAQTAGGSDFVLLEIDITPKTSTLIDVIFKIDGITVHKVTDFTFTSMGAMAPVAVIKAGGANAETMLIDFIGLAQVR